jgi:ATP-dependent Clp protease ATP-binding subunit ClpC
VLNQEQIMRIVDLQMKEIAARLKEQGIEIELTQEAREWLAAEGYDPQFGARPLRRTLQRKVESPLSRKLLSGEFKSGDMIAVDHHEKEGLAFLKKQVSEPPAIMETASTLEAA